MLATSSAKRRSVVTICAVFCTVFFDDLYCRRGLSLGLVFISPVLHEFGQMVWMNPANVFDFDIHFDWIGLAKSYARLPSYRGEAVDWFDFYWILRHSAFVFSR